MGDHSSPSSASFPPRPEFQHTSTRPDTSFALLALNGTSRIRGLNFPAELYSRLTTCIKRTWLEGIEWATLRSGDGWDCLLKGTPWKKKGSEELESIGLILELLRTLSREGWNLMQDVKVGSAKKDIHNFVFRYDDFPTASDKFFTVTFPLPNRISLVDSPATGTPAIITSIRSAITSPDQSPDLRRSPRSIRTDHSSPKLGFGSPHSDLDDKENGGRMYIPAIGYMTGKSIAKADVSGTRKKIKIKDEGWVGTGVYGFKLAGYSVFAGKGISDFKYDSNHPAVLLAMITNLNQHHSHLVTSVRLSPLNDRRDILIFMDTTHEHDFDAAEHFALPPRLSFPPAETSPVSPNFAVNMADGHRKSQRAIRVRPSSLASLNGGPLLPSIPASPSWEEDDLLDPPTIHQHVAHDSNSIGGVTPYPAIISPLTTAPLSLSTDQRGRKHKKGSGMPGNVINAGWTAPQASKLQHVNTLDSSEILRDSLDQTTDESGDFVLLQHCRSGKRPERISPIFVSNGKIMVKDVTAAHLSPTFGYAHSDSPAVRNSEAAELGMMDSEPPGARGSNSDGGNQTATSTFTDNHKADAIAGEFKPSPIPRRGLRGFMRSLF